MLASRGAIPEDVVEASENTDQHEFHASGFKRPRPGATTKTRPLAIKTMSKGTRLCKFELAGACKRGAECTFAHSTEELQPLPELKHTLLCSRFKAGGKCRQGSSCKFAHGLHQLRQMPSVLDRPSVPEQQAKSTWLEAHRVDQEFVEKCRLDTIEDTKLENELHSEDVGLSAESGRPYLPTLEAYLRAGMLAGSYWYSDDDAGGDDKNDTSCSVASTSLEVPTGLPQDRAQEQAYLRQELVHMQWQEQFLMRALQTLGNHSAAGVSPTTPLPPQRRRESQPISCKMAITPQAVRCQSKTMPENPFGSTETECVEEEDVPWQPRAIQIYPGQVWPVSVKNTFIHVEIPDRLDGASNRCKSVPAAMKFGHAS